MKRKTFITSLACVALAGAFAFGASGCAKPGPAAGLMAPYGVGGFISADALSKLEGYGVESIDKNGVIYASRYENDGYTYALYDIDTDTLVTSADIGFHTPTGYNGESFYYTLTNTTAEGSDAATSYTYTFYNGTEKVQTITQDKSISFADGIATFDDGKVIYMGVDGEVYYGERGVRPVATLANTVRYGDNYVIEDGDGSIYVVFDADGNYVRMVNLLTAMREFAYPTSEVKSWQIGSKMFMQGGVALPDDASDYDYYQNGTKYDLRTYSVDIVSGETAEIGDFNVKVNKDENSSQNPYEYAVLSVNKILDNKTLSAVPYIQAYGADGKVYADLQALLPGATDIVFGADILILTDGAEYVCFNKNGDRFASINEYMGVEPLGGEYFSDGKTVYDGNMNAVFEMPENGKFIQLTEGKLYYRVTEQPEGGAAQTKYYVYDIAGRNSSEISVADGETMSGNSMFYLVKDGDGAYAVRDYYGNAVLEDIPVPETGNPSIDASVISASNERGILIVLAVQTGATVRNYLVKYGLNGSIPE